MLERKIYYDFSFLSPIRNIDCTKPGRPENNVDIRTGDLFNMRPSPRTFCDHYKVSEFLYVRRMTVHEAAMCRKEFYTFLPDSEDSNGDFGFQTDVSQNLSDSDNGPS
jgi:hypothetical protein